MTGWTRYDKTPNTVTGDLRVWRGLESGQLGNARDVLVWLPPGYEAGTQQYPVLYMHDGQNLFDAVGSYAGEWQVDETLTALHGDGIDAIVVGVPNGGDLRRVEYSPYDYEMAGQWVQGRGAAYIDFLVETVKPLIDGSFRTRTEARATGIAGSSMGGLISLYGFVKRPDVFGLCGAFSTAYWFGQRGGQNGLLATVQAEADGHGRVYLDVGTKEGETLVWFTEVDAAVDLDAAYVQGVRDLYAALVARGYEDGRNLMYVEEVGAEHREEAWARRLPAALRFLLGGKE